MTEFGENGTSSSGVLAVVLNWNGQDLTSQCLEHLRRQNYPALDLLVVDNGSTDRSLENLKEGGLREHEILSLNTNLGFSGGMNQGIRKAQADNYAYVWLLNNDAFPDPDCLSALVRLLDQNPMTGMVTPRLVGADGLDQHVGGRLQANGCDNDWVFADEPFPTGIWITGTAPLVRVSCLNEVGVLDEKFFAYWEDVDLSFRCLLAGWELKCEPSARCVHLGGSSSEGLQSQFCYHMAIRNAGMFSCKHLPWTSRPGYLLQFLAHVVDRAALEDLCGRTAVASAMIGGFTALLRGASGRPTSLITYPWLERAFLKHWWGISRLARTISGYLPSSSLEFGQVKPGQVPDASIDKKASSL